MSTSGTPVYKKQIYCKVQFEGFHAWPECPIEEVSFLRDTHRHIFHIVAFKTVSHDDRDIEFIVLKHKIERYLNERYPNGRLGSMSCEMIAIDLIERFELDACDVSEDNENGALITAIGKVASRRA